MNLFGMFPSKEVDKNIKMLQVHFGKASSEQPHWNNDKPFI